VRLGISLWPQGVTWDDLCAASVRADASGFDSIWSYDHFVALGTVQTVPVLDGWTVISALAALTSHARLGVLVTGVTHRNPAVLAKMAATVDHVSKGRAVLGLGAAWNESEHRAYGIEFPPAADRLDRLDEACTVIRSLFQDNTTTFAGGHYSLDAAVLWPKPVQAHLPILIGGSGERRTLRLVARHADLWNAFGTPDVVTHKLAVLDEHCKAVGRNPSTIEVTVNVGVIVRDSTAAVQDRLDQLGEVADFPDYAASNCPYGTPDQVAERLAEYARVGVSEVIVMMPTPYDHETIDRLATEVRSRLERLLQ